MNATVESEWQDFKTFVYPGMPDHIEQMRQLKACWFASFFAAMEVIHKISAMDEDEAVKKMSELYDEATTHMKVFTDEEMKRQGIKPM